jgi:hypothetical protein
MLQSGLKVGKKVEMSATGVSYFGDGHGIGEIMEVAKSGCSGKKEARVKFSNGDTHWCEANELKPATVSEVETAKVEVITAEFDDPKTQFANGVRVMLTDSGAEYAGIKSGQSRLGTLKNVIIKEKKSGCSGTIQKSVEQFHVKLDATGKTSKGLYAEEVLRVISEPTKVTA